MSNSLKPDAKPDQNTLSDFRPVGYYMGEMQPKSDAQLLRDYAEHGTEAAFAELVHRHTNLVYSAALRQVEAPASAAEITQNVFVGLARGAKSLYPRLAADASLAGWLCRSARNLSLNHRRDEFRRQTRERQVMEQLASNPEDTSNWENLRGRLDEAMAELTETDYDALVLRYFQHHDFRAVGVALGVSDDTAQKRVTRALEKLREVLSRRGISTSATALSVIISANAVHAAPVGLVVAISTAAALTGTTLATTATVTATKAIAMTTIQKTLITATVAVLAGAGIYEARQASQLREQFQALREQQAEQIQQLQSERDDAANQLAALRGDIERLNQNSGELLKLRGEAGLFRKGNNEAAQLGAENLMLKRRLAQLEGAWRFTTNAPQFKNPFFARDGWTDQGTVEPLNALQTMLWAIKQDDNGKLAQLVSRTDDSESLDSLLLPKRFWDKVTGVQIVDIAIISSGGLQRKAIIGTILQKQGPPNDSLGSPYENAALEAYRNSEQSMRRWFFVETNGQWLITGGG